MLEIKGYITNLGKYNEGELIGEWITFPIDDDELNEVFKRIGLNHYDEDMDDVITGYEEYFFTDWETNFDSAFGEYENIDDINEFAEQLQEWDEDTFKAACEYWGVNYVDVESPDGYLLLSDVLNESDLGYYYAFESGGYEIDQNSIVGRYFDYERFGRDLAIELDGGFTSKGWIERIC